MENNLGIGGNEVRIEENESIADIPQNRTLLVEKLTDTAPVRPEFVDGLKTIDDVFENYKPSVKVKFEDEDGAIKNEELKFRGLKDFGVRGLTLQSDFLTDLTTKKDQYMVILKQLKTNKLLKQAIQNSEHKEALLNTLKSMIAEIEETK